MHRQRIPKRLYLCQPVEIRDHLGASLARPIEADAANACYFGGPKDAAGWTFAPPLSSQHRPTSLAGPFIKRGIAARWTQGETI
jgi:hypothetical protein